MLGRVCVIMLQCFVCAQWSAEAAVAASGVVLLALCAVRRWAVCLLLAGGCCEG